MGHRKKSRVSHLAKLTPKQVRDIRSRAAIGESQALLAKLFKVSITAISLLLSGKTYRHVSQSSSSTKGEPIDGRVPTSHTEDASE